MKTLSTITKINNRFSTLKHDPNKILQHYYKKNQLLTGHCDLSGSTNYRNRFVQAGTAHQSFFTKFTDQIQENQYFTSSIGIGTQNGQPKPQDDVKMAEVLAQALTSGINYIDTDVNFRYGKSQKVINAVLNYLIKDLGYNRNQFFIATKFGYLPTDVDSQLTPEKLVQVLKNQRFISDQNIIENIYAWGEGFIDFTLQKSRLSLGLSTIDCMFLNNFSQAQMSLISQDQFKRRLKITFTKLQQARADQRIKNYGMCSFVGFRSPPNQQGVHLNLQQMCNFVKDSVGSSNGFKYIMLPLNLGMPEALLKWQKYQDKEKEQTLRIFEVAQKQGLKIVLCSPLFQGRVANLPFSSPKMNYLQSNAAKHLQFIRSIDSKALLTTVFGTINVDHLRQNMQVLCHPKVTRQDWNQILPMPQ